jgi:hypothetical protein
MKLLASPPTPTPLGLGLYQEYFCTIFIQNDITITKKNNTRHTANHSTGASLKYFSFCFRYIDPYIKDNTKKHVLELHWPKSIYRLDTIT